MCVVYLARLKGKGSSKCCGLHGTINVKGLLNACSLCGQLKKVKGLINICCLHCAFKR